VAGYDQAPQDSGTEGTIAWNQGHLETEMRRSREVEKVEIIEVGNRTRRRPKRMGLCRGKHAEVGKMAKDWVHRAWRREYRASMDRRWVS